MDSVSETVQRDARRVRIGNSALGLKSLGPKQLTWLRRNIRSFKLAEEQWLQIRQDELRAARNAGVL